LADYGLSLALISVVVVAVLVLVDPAVADMYNQVVDALTG